MGLEALSRGARRCVFVESDRAACRAIDANLEKLRLTGALVLCQDAFAALRQERAAGRRYDLVLFDPPYGAWPALEERLAAALPPRPRRGRPAGRRDGRAHGAGACRSTPSRAAATVPRDSPSSPDDHRDLPRHLRPGHERARRRDRARRLDLRPARRRRRQRPAPQAADVHAGRARRVPAGGDRAGSTTSRSRSSRSSSSTSPSAGTRR